MKKYMLIFSILITIVAIAVRAPLVYACFDSANNSCCDQILDPCGGGIPPDAN